MSSERAPLMESEDNNATPSPSAADARRRSGRVVRAPRKFTEEVAAQTDTSARRKRARDNDDDDAENQEPHDSLEEASDQEPAEESDDEDLAPKNKKSKSRAKKPAAKKPKINGSAPVETAEPQPQAMRLPNRPKKTVRVAIARKDGDGLYAEIFGSGMSSNDVAGQWFQRYQENDAAALTDLVNCVLLATGCNEALTEDDIRDPENSANKLSELEEAFEQTSISEYPLISRAKSSKDFRLQLIGFFESLISLLHETDSLYQDSELLDNIQRWVGIMSASSLRPFRHTATTIGLSLLGSMITVTKFLDDRITRSNQAIQAESSRRGKNKSLIATTQKQLDTATENRQTIDEKVKDFFDIIFVHRYRDIDAKIRAECIEALGNWICTLPTVYMAPEYLRYLGWLLSDVAPATRLEVLKQLGRVLKRDAGKLAHFIDRFRPRLVEMATKDHDLSVRVAAVGVVDVLRSSGMLEPDEVDSICKLLFESESKVRKAVVPFFVELIQDVISNKIDEIGGEEVLDEVFGQEEDADYNSPHKVWINIKALAENLAVYNAQLDQDQDDIRHGLDVAADVVNANIPESRIVLATQALYEKMPEISNWQSLAGYLLFDHTTSSKSRSKSKTNSVEAATRKAVAPTSDEEAILMEVLATAVKESFTQGGDHDRSRRRLGRLELDGQDDVGMQLAEVVPKFLNKYGSDPHIASVVLRLEHYIDLDVFQQLRQNSAAYDKLLDAVTAQFNRHVDEAVLNEASTALLHARRYDELEELTDSKLTILWDNSLNALRTFEKTTELTTRGNLDRAALAELANVLKKISKLTVIADCVDTLEAPGTDGDFEDPAIKILIGIVDRGFLAEPDEALDDPEDEVVAFAIRSCLLYFLWKVARLKTAMKNEEDIPNEEADRLIRSRKDFVGNLIRTFSSRGFNDDLRLSAVGTACDICGLFSFLRPFLQGAQAAKYGKLKSLTEEIPSGLIPAEVIPIFEAAERAYAQRANKHLNPVADDEDPLDDEAPPEDDEDEELTDQEKQAAELKAEKILCDLTGKLVLGILGKIIDATGPHAGKLRKRLLRNKTKLGPNFKEVVAFLDEDHKKKTAPRKKDNVPKAAKSAELVIDDDDEDEEQDPFAEEEVEAEEGTEQDLRNRELLDDPILDDEDDERPPEPMEEDSVIGD